MRNTNSASDLEAEMMPIIIQLSTNYIASHFLKIWITPLKFTRKLTLALRDFRIFMQLTELIRLSIWKHESHFADLRNNFLLRTG